MKKLHGYHGVLLDVDLSSGKIHKRELDPDDLRAFMGGRGLGMKLLWDALPEPGVKATAPENPLILVPGPFSGLPLPSSSRTAVVTKSPLTAPSHSAYEHASTVAYSNMGGFIGPEIRFAGYDAIMVRGRASQPVYLHIDDERVEIRDARKYWGMGTDDFDRAFTKELRDRRFQSCYIGVAGENQVAYASILNTTARAAGRSGCGCVMGSKNLKAIAVRGSGQPDVAMHKHFLQLLEQIRDRFRNSASAEGWRRYGTSLGVLDNDAQGLLTTKNFREGSYNKAVKVSGVVARRRYWERDFACYLCPYACKKAGKVSSGRYAGIVHDGPEYETSTMLGPNLLIADLPGVLRSIYLTDDFGVDAISAGNVIGFLMEAYDKRMIDRRFADGLDLAWGNIDTVHQLLRKIVYREGIGEEASKGVRHLASLIGQDSHKFAIHSKGQEFAAWNCHPRPSRALGYATANRGACHLSGENVEEQHARALNDSTGVCLFVQGGYGKNAVPDALRAVTGFDWTAEEYRIAGERIFNLEKCFNYREGFRRVDDHVPDRFFEEPFTTGPKRGAVIDRDKFERMQTDFYERRDWDPETTRPSSAKLSSLGLGFADSSS